MSIVQETFSAILFDMDGTLVDSTPGVEGAWETFANDYGLTNVQEVISQAHGIRTVENLKRVFGITDPEVLEREAQRFEMEIVNSSKKNGRTGILILPGALEALAPFQAATPPEGKQLWAICTSATRAYAAAALGTTGIKKPTAFVASEDVSKGKPDPEPYLAGAKQCNVEPSNCLVIEDAPAGITAGKKAGAKVLGVLTSHSLESVKAASPDWIVSDLTHVSFSVDNGETWLDIDDIFLYSPQPHASNLKFLLLAMTVPVSDSVPLYSEGTFDEHIQELTNYLARGRSDEERTAFIRPFVEELMPKENQKPFDEDEGRRRHVLGMVVERVNGVGEGTDREIEGFFNLLVAYVFDNYSNPTGPIERLLHTIVSAHRPPAIKYRLLSNIFNATPRTSPLRPKIYTSLLKLASHNEELDVLHLHQADVDKWLNEWDIDVEERAEFCKSIANAFVKAGQPGKAYPYLILRAQMLPGTSPNADSALIEVIVDGLRLSSIFNFEPILNLPNITLVKTHPLYKLLKVFILGQGLAQYHVALAEVESELSKHNLDKNALEKKIRLVALTSLASARVGKEITYAEIAHELQVPETEVESWVIQAIRAKLILGKLNQPSKTFVVIRSTTRQFKPEDWETLDTRLTAWKGAILDVLQVVSAARRKVPVGGTQ